MRSNRYSFEHATRLLKLLRVFRELSKDKVTGTFSNTFLCIRDAFGHSLPSAHLYDADDFLRKVVIFAKKKLAEKDLDIVSQSHAAVFSRLSAMVEQYLKAWPDQDQYTLQFLRETVPAMLRNNSPLLASIDDIIELFREAIIKSDFDSIEALGLAKYFIGKSTFSMRTQESRVLAQSALVKVLLNIVKDAPSELFIKELYPNLEGNSVIYL
jgi:predicted metal-dependent RNase